MHELFNIVVGSSGGSVGSVDAGSSVVYNTDLYVKSIYMQIHGKRYMTVSKNPIMRYCHHHMQNIYMYYVCAEGRDTLQYTERNVHM